MVGEKKSGVPAVAGVGGHVVLDFVNTCGGSGKVRDDERLIDWHAAVNWAIENRLLTQSDSRRLEKARSRAGQHPSDLLAELTEFREAMHAVFAAIAARSPLPERARVRLEAHIVQALGH